MFDVVKLAARICVMGVRLELELPRANEHHRKQQKEHARKKN